MLSERERAFVAKVSRVFDGSMSRHLTQVQVMLAILVAHMAAQSRMTSIRLRTECWVKGLTRGGIIEALLKLQVLLLRAPKRCFCLSKVFAAVWCSLLVPHFIILAHFLAMWASYICSPHPKGIPLVSSTIDVLLGRSIKLSDDAASPHANSIVSINLFKRQSIVEHHESHTQIGHRGKRS